jgi:hypothetical protein
MGARPAQARKQRSQPRPRLVHRSTPAAQPWRKVTVVTQATDKGGDETADSPWIDRGLTEDGPAVKRGALAGFLFTDPATLRLGKTQGVYSRSVRAC